jgi:hypothetical protein
MVNERSGVAMVNRKVLVIPASSVFLKYRKIEKDFLRVAVYSEKLFPLQTADMMQRFYSNVFSMQSSWKLVGIYTGDNGLSKNKDNFSMLLKLCKSFEENEIGPVAALLGIAETEFRNKYIKERLGEYQLNTKPCYFLMDKIKKMILNLVCLF